MTAWRPRLITVDVGGTLGSGQGATLTARLVAASPLAPETARALLRTTLHTAPKITGKVVRQVCDALRIPPSAFPAAAAPSRLRLFPGVLASLRDISRYAPVVTLSDVSAADADTETLRDQLSPWVSDCLASCYLGYAKPDPRAFHTTAARYGVHTPQILHLGDHWECDVIGAAEAGARPVWISHGNPLPADSLVTGGDVAVANDLIAAVTHIKQLFTRRDT